MKRETKFAYVVELHTKTPNVPYGDAFEVVTRYCLTFERPTATRMHVSTAVEFGRSVFWESMIEKGALDGTTAFSRDLATALVNRLKNGDRDALIGPVPSLLRPGRKRSSQTAISSPVGAISSPLQTFVDSANVQQSKTQRWSPLTLMEFLMSLSREQLVFGFFIFNMFLSAFTAYQYIRWNGRLRLISDRTGVSTEQLQLYLRYRSTTILDDNTIQPRSMEERWTETELLMDDLRSELSLQQKYFSSIASGKGGVKSNRRSANYDIVVC
jgi:hypothetical protein